MRLNNADVRSLILDCLRTENDRRYEPTRSPYGIDALCIEAASVAKAREYLTSTGNAAWISLRTGCEKLHPHLEIIVRDIVWDLIIEGVLRPGSGEHSMELPKIHLTEFGKSVLDGDHTPYDAAGYVKEIRSKIPNVDPVILQYISESSETLRRNCLLSSTITMGCASEKAFLLLIETYGNALNSAEGKKFTEEIGRLRSIKQQHAKFKEWYDRKLRAQLRISNDSDWLSGLDDCLHFVFAYFRDIRNDAGHPTGVVFTREKVHSHLVIFPSYLRLIYDLIEWLESNAPLAS